MLFIIIIRPGQANQVRSLGMGQGLQLLDLHSDPPKTNITRCMLNYMCQSSFMITVKVGVLYK